MEKLHNFYFVRHGQTNWGPDDILKGPQNLALNDIGLQQAHKAGLILKDLINSSPNPKIISSSLRRAVETAKVIEEIIGIPISSYENGFNEHYYGDYRLISDDSKIPPDLETTKIFQQRVLQTFYKILSENNGNTTLIIVSHQKVFEYLVEFLVKRSEKIFQGGIGHFIFNENGTWNVFIY
jgi:probable phosphoglycerate mutase